MTLLDKVILELKDDSEISFIENKDVCKIPTLKKGVYRDISRMLVQRFEKIGSWIDSTHGDWLALDEMESILWDTNQTDERLTGIFENITASAANWENDAMSLFLPERLSLFAASAYTTERVFLLWLDGVEEPEFWVYDTNGFGRFKNFEVYLESFLNDDLSAYNDSKI